MKGATVNVTKIGILAILALCVFGYPSPTSASTVNDRYIQPLSQNCKDTPATCSPSEIVEIGKAISQCNSTRVQSICDDTDRAFLGSAAINSTGAGNQINGSNQVAGDSCGLTNLTACWRWFMATMGQLWLTVGGYLVLSAGTIFDVLIKYVIVDFKGTLEMLGTPGTNALTTINLVWTVFRDFANILIIGMFVFIAVSLILGLKEFGQKKLIANVLIVAVLLNFSLLFTTLVIDGSNFVAKQFYSGMAVSTTGGSGGIAQAFLKPMGITTIWEDAGKLTKEAAKQKESGWAAFFLGVIGGLMLIIVAFTLLYGSYLIAARGVLFLVLMITSAVAFATYLIPSLSSGEYGFKAWLKTLLNAAIFAPLLMLSLAASLAIIVTASKLPTPSLGSIVVEPKDLVTSAAAGDAWQSIFLYALGTALLFVSFRLSSKFAGHISGFNLGALATMIPTGLAARFVAAPLLRGRLGGQRALEASDRYQGAARTANLNASMQTARATQYSLQADKYAREGNSAEAKAARDNAAIQRRLAEKSVKNAAGFLEKAAAKREAAGRTYNLMDTRGAKAINAAIGNSGALSGETSKDTNYLAELEKKAKRAAAMAENARPADDALRDQAKEEARQKHESDLRMAQTAHQDAIRAQEIAEKNAQEQRESTLEQSAAIRQQQALAEEGVKIARANKAGKVTQQEGLVRELLERIQKAPSEQEKTRLRGELSDMERAHAYELKDADAEIAQKQSIVERHVKDHYEKIEKPIAEAEGLAKKARDNVQAAQSQINQVNATIAKASDELFRSYKEGAQNATLDVASYIGNKIGDPKIAEAARSRVKKQQGTSATLRKLMKDGGIISDAPENKS